MAQSCVEDDFTESVDRNCGMDEADSIDKTSLVNQDSSDDGDVVIPLTKAKKRVQRFAESCSDSGKAITQYGDESPLSNEEVILPSKQTFDNDSDSSSDTSIFKNHPQKSRIRQVSSEEDSDSHSQPSDKKEKVPLKNKEQQVRMFNKRDKLRNKFESLINSRGKDDNNLSKDLDSDDDCNYEWMDDESENSEDGSSIEKLKQVGQVYLLMEQETVLS